MTTHCAACGAGICGRQAVISRILGGRGRCFCLACLSTRLAAPPEQLCDLVGNMLAHRECYRKEWRAALPCDRDGQAPCCPSRLEHAAVPPSWCRAELFEEEDVKEESLPAPHLRVDAEESGCGDLMVLLMRSIRKLQPGQVLELTARDPGAGADIPSWCRLTGHALLAGPTGPESALFYIRRKSDA